MSSTEGKIAEDTKLQRKRSRNQDQQAVTTSDKRVVEEGDLPEPPTKPLDSDCCGSGCTPCVFDIYDAEVAQWQRLCEMNSEERAAALASNKTTAPVAANCLSQTNYTSLTITDMKKITEDTFLYRFALPPNTSLNMCVGQHLVLRAKNHDGAMVSRQYTPISKLDQTNYFEVVIKLYPGGAMSQHISQWNVGSHAEWKGPFGSFTYQPNKFKRIGMLACGTGIAPMVQVIRHIVENENDDTRIHLVYGCRTQHDILMKDFLDECRQFWNFSVLYAFSNTSPQEVQTSKGTLKYQDNVHYGRITFDLLSSQLPPPLPAVSNCFLICGTKSFDKDMINYLLRLGYDKCHYFKF